MQFGLMRELSIGHKHSGVVISYVFFFLIYFVAVSIYIENFWLTA